MAKNIWFYLQDVEYIPLLCYTVSRIISLYAVLFPDPPPPRLTRFNSPKIRGPTAASAFGCLPSGTVQEICIAISSD